VKWRQNSHHSLIIENCKENIMFSGTSFMKIKQEPKSGESFTHIIESFIGNIREFFKSNSLLAQYCIYTMKETSHLIAFNVQMI
jgi:hypothetical protein